MSAAGDSQPAAAGELTDAMPGQRLGQARAAQNLTAADVARRLKLSVWQIEALESGRYDRLPGPVFVRGFIRNYARLLKLDPDDLLHAAAGNLPQAAPPPDAPLFRDIPMPSSTGWRWQKYAIGAAAIVALLAVYEFNWNEPEPEPESEARPPVAVVPEPPAPVSSQEITSAKNPATTATIPAAAPVARAPTPTPSAAQNSPKPAPGKPASAGERELRFDFDEESWVEIRDSSDRTIFSQLNLAGTSRRVTGVPPLFLVVGNAQGVRMTYAGKPVDLARHTKTEVARLKLE